MLNTVLVQAFIVTTPIVCIGNNIGGWEEKSKVTFKGISENQSILIRYFG